MVDLDKIRTWHLKLDANWQSLHARCSGDGQRWPCDAIQLANALEAALARVARLEEALRRWTTADHGYPLHIGRCESADGGPCTCGLEEAISALATTEAAP